MSESISIENICKSAKKASEAVSCLDAQSKNNCLTKLIDDINLSREEIKNANTVDIDCIEKSNEKDAFVDRLLINDERIDSIISSLEEVIALDDPVGKIRDVEQMKSGIKVGKMSMPLGLICMIYESRPNVTIDAASLCLKSGNAVILRGGSESINTNLALSKCLDRSLASCKIPSSAVTLIKSTNREHVKEILKKDKYIDIVIPRGGKKLIELVDQISSIPVLKHLDGICHVFIDKDADIEKAMSIAINSKTQRYGVCNAMETLLISKDVEHSFLHNFNKVLQEKGVELRGCEKSKSIISDIKIAKEEDWSTEYLAPILSIKIVSDCSEAMDHIAKYGSGHTDVIVTENNKTAELFLRNVNSSSVMHNASSRFADGYEYGLGAEIGISTNKLHARGPVGIEGLTNEKFIVLGNGNIR